MSYKSFFKYRSVWMFFAVICVIMSHQTADTPNAFIRFFLYYGAFGVDIFLFASGIGCYFSYKKNGYRRFLEHRAVRILPSFLPFMLIWCGVKLVRNEISVFAAAANLLSLQLFMDPNEAFNWYVSAMWVLYFLTPVFAAGADRIKKKPFVLLWLLLLILITLPTIRLHLGNGTHLLFTRFPIFFLGMCFSKFSMENEKLPWGIAAAFIVCIPIGIFILIYCSMNHPSYLTEYGVYWYPFIGIAPGMCIGISLLCSVIEKIPVGKTLVLFFDRLGSYSFEIYLIHFTAIKLTKKYIDRCAPGQIKAFLLCTAMIVSGVFVLKIVSRPIAKALKRLLNSRKESAAV